jgi:hypothetical protein
LALSPISRRWTVLDRWYPLTLHAVRTAAEPALCPSYSLSPRPWAEAGLPLLDQYWLVCGTQCVISVDRIHAMSALCVVYQAPVLRE